MRNGFFVLWMLLCSITSAAAQVSVGIGLPGVSIGINVPVYPELVPVPGYPVYYAPRVNSNYFFYDGMYWLYTGDNWYASSWYNGPWGLVAPEAVPLFVLRVPVRYYRRPPAYFHGWRSDAPPRWGEHWGNSWEQGRRGWDNWDRGSVPPPAPLPVYQRQYSGNRYPRVEQQQVLQSQNYRYQPHDAAVQQHYQAPQVQSAPAPTPQARQRVPQERSSSQQDQRGSKPTSSLQQGAAAAPHGQPQQGEGANVQRSTAHAPPPQSGPTAQPQQQQQPRQAAVQRQQQPQQGAPQHQQQQPQQAVPQRQQQPQQAAPQRQPQQAAPQRQQQPQQAAPQRQQQQPQQAVAQHQQQAPGTQSQDKGPQGKGPTQEPKQGQEKGRDKGEQQGGERNK
jgi:hypothetical protein